ncbi:helix-turn-helix domain-containing protein [Bordetella sp. H567]|uniref:helix-turn-helix domain-containing protein n=1 Tax=Bordetella sp. H567 TaxID=1697043 RepID=UPI000A8FDFA2|nr:helix-turn-helix domain-containing protein [Bordetella sp. H567]
MKSISEISAQLRTVMRHNGVTQESVRESAGISRQTMVNVLKGTEDFKVSTLLAVADRLGLELLLVPKDAARGLQPPTAAAPVVETMVDQVRKRLQAADRPADGKKR